MPTNPLSHDIIYEDVLPLVWKPADTPLSLQQQVRLNEHNETVLRVMMTHQEKGCESIDSTAMEFHAMAALDAKLDMVIQLLSGLLMQQKPLPEQLPMRLSAYTLEWQPITAPIVGCFGVIDLYLAQSCLLPLQLPGHVTKQTSLDYYMFTFAGMDKLIRNGLEKFIFRHHRRLVAKQRNNV